MNAYYRLILLLGFVFTLSMFACGDDDDDDDSSDDDDDDAGDDGDDDDDDDDDMEPPLRPAVFIAADWDDQLVLFREVQTPGKNDTPVPLKSSLAGPFDGHTSIVCGWTSHTESGQEVVAQDIDHPVIAMDTANFLHAVYEERFDDRIVYAENSTGEWKFTPIDWGTLGDLALDQEGSAHIAYYNNALVLKKATNADGAWDLETVGFGNVFEPSIDVDNQGATWIAAVGDAWDKPGVSVFSDDRGQWQEQIAARGFFAGSFGRWFAGPDIAIGPDDSVRVAYKFRRDWVTGMHPPTFYCDPGVRLKERRLGWWNTDWEVREGQGSWDGVEAPRLVIDSTGATHLVYLFNDDIVYTTDRYGPWITLEVRSWCNDCAGWDLAVDDKGSVHISFIEEYDRLIYVTNSSGVFVYTYWE